MQEIRAKREISWDVKDILKEAFDYNSKQIAGSSVLISLMIKTW